jgi:hypothetical protein
MAIGKGELVRSVAALALLAQCLVANATPITTAPETELFNLTPGQANFQVSNNSTTNPPVVTNTNSGPQSAGPTLLNFNQFNSALGVLTGVSVSFTSAYRLAPNLSVTFLSAPDPFDPDLIQFFADGTLNLSLTGLGLISAQSPGPLAASATCTTDHVACNPVVPPATGNFNGTTSGLSLAPFIGAGSYNLTVGLSSVLAPRISPDNGTSFADNATMNGTFDTNWAGSVSVVYTYEPFATVAEPARVYLILAGLAGIALLPRRRA